MTEAAGTASEPTPLRRAWYLAGRASAIERGPVGVQVLGLPLVLFRAESGFGALVDRCPHRGVPLSLGRVREGRLECAYHGWRFDEVGRCIGVPASTRTSALGRAHQAEPRPVVEQQGFVWVCPEPEAPETPPFWFPHLGDPRYAHTVKEAEMPASLLATAENILDVPHTAFLHGGWFRRAPSRPIRAEVERAATTARARFVGEPAPGGLLGRLLAGRTDTVEHEDRFELPSIAEVEYRLGSSHLVITSALTPVTEERTRMTSVAALRLKWGSGWVVRLLAPFAGRVLGQDAFILGALSENARRFPDRRGVSTEVDLLGPHIARLLRDAASGTVTPPSEREVELRV